MTRKAEIEKRHKEMLETVASPNALFMKSTKMTRKEEIEKKHKETLAKIAARKKEQAQNAQKCKVWVKPPSKKEMSAGIAVNDNRSDLDTIDQSRNNESTREQLMRQVKNISKKLINDDNKISENSESFQVSRPYKESNDTDSESEGLRNETSEDQDKLVKYGPGRIAYNKMISNFKDGKEVIYKEFGEPTVMQLQPCIPNVVSRNVIVVKVEVSLKLYRKHIFILQFFMKVFFRLVQYQ